MLSRDETFGVLDGLGAALAALGALALATFPTAGGNFAAMFEDFGSLSELPLLTRLATTTWFPLLLAATVAGMLGVGFGRRAPARRYWLLGAVVLGAAGFALCLVGVYLPIFAIAGAIKAD
jgi:hypothetical protein